MGQDCSVCYQDGQISEQVSLCQFKNVTSIKTGMDLIDCVLQIINTCLMECLTKFYKCLCCIQDPIYPDPYNFTFGHPDSTAQNKLLFESNFVRTSKYHWYDFIPKSLLLQFKRLANVYFLIIGILQSIPIISPLGPLTAWGPLITVLGISMIREGYEDYQRYKSDKQLNHESTTLVFRNGEFVQVQWSQIVVGEVVKVESEELFPVDLILLSSSADGGNAFIETASLDGEKNLKPRNAYPQTQALQSQSQLSVLRGRWQGIVPDKQLHRFSSNMTIDRQQTINFQKDKQLLYRGARLKNTKWIYGLAIYTGRNSKIMMNADSSSEKMSQIEVKVNRILAIILCLQLVLCLIIACFNAGFTSRFADSDTYIDWSGNTVGADATLIFFTYFVLINTMIPISLVVSIQIVKMSQSYFIDKDRLMYSQFRKKYCNVKSASLNQELGQIEYVFTDKTGTLTMNLMEFKIAVIGRRMYGDLGLIMNNPNYPPQMTKGFRDDDLTRLVQQGEGNQEVPDVFVRDREGRQNIGFKHMRELAEEYLTALAITHEVVAEVDKKGKKFYQGPSPDEITLVDAAREMGFEFDRATQNTTQLTIHGQAKKYQLLQTFAFNSDRKRMSVVIRSGGLIKMYMKGADSIVKSRLASDNKLNLDDELHKFAVIGLRTLLVGMRVISEAEYSEFRRKVESLPPTNKQQALNQIISDLERNVYLIGATAVLDRLQEEVPETIRDLIRANVKVWMLTGDKMETAQNIAKSCNLIQKDFEVLKYSCKERERIPEALRQLGEEASRLEGLNISKGLLIEGQDLTPIIGNDQNETQLANIAKYCEAVVCCRLLPIQKAQVVRIVRTKLDKITLSIGDGANDVPMIKTAHIGIGLFGEQGMGAVQASDYALPQFRMLWRLMLVHGRWNYIRVAEMILYFFYKNMLFTVPQFIFAFYCGFSGQTIFDDIYIALYNLIFTSLPLVVRAVLEQDVYYIQPSKPQEEERLPSEEPRREEGGTLSSLKPHILQSRMREYVPRQYEMNKYIYRLFPKIYFIGQENCIFNYSNFFLWTLEGILEAILITLFGLYIFDSPSINADGHSPDLWIASLAIFTSIVLVVTFKLSTHTKFWSVLLFVCILVLSLGLYIAYMWLSNYYFSDYLKGSVQPYYQNAQTYFLVLFCSCVVLLVDGLVLSIDFQRGGYASRIRRLIQSEQQHNKVSFRQESIRTSEYNTRHQVMSVHGD